MAIRIMSLVLWIACFTLCTKSIRPAGSMLLGGLSPIKPADSGVQKMCEKVKESIETKTGANYNTFEAVSYKTQVVSGIMYYVKIRVGSIDNCIHVKIWHHWSGRLEIPVSGVEKNKSCADPINAF